ncbi:MAG: hypothetical protein QXE63_04685 [Zestosphaera sp.]
MRKKLVLFLLLLSIVLLMGLLFNPRVYAYNLEWFLLRLVEVRREVIELHCAGFILTERFTENFRVSGYNALCKDALGRSVYEHIRVNIVARSMGTMVYRTIAFFYVNISSEGYIEVVVEKPLSENQLLILLENKYTRIAVNVSTVTRVRLYIQPGEHYCRITFILHAVKPGRENFRVGFYLGTVT